MSYSLQGSPDGPYLNEAGQVAGNLVPPGGDTWAGPSRGFIWTNGKLVTLPTLAGGSLTVTALNNLGQVAGSSLIDADTTHAVLYRNKRLIDLGTLSGGNSAATAINDNGQVVGWADDHSGTTPGQDGFISSGGKLTALGLVSGYTQVVAVNNLGQVIVKTTDYSTNATNLYVWHKRKATPLDATAGFSLAGINDHGIVAGSRAVPGGYYAHATEWDASGA